VTTRMGRGLGVALVVCWGLTAGVAAAETAGTVRQMGRGEKIRILRPKARYPDPMTLRFGADHVTFRLNSDGLLTVTKVGGSVGLVVVAGAKEVSVELSRGQEISVWMLSDMIASVEEGLSLRLRMTSWSFAFRADRAGPLGLLLKADGGESLLYDGQRVDSVKSPTGEIRLARSAAPVRVVRTPKRGGEREEPEYEVAEGEPVAPGPPPYPPGGRNLSETAGIPGATIALPPPAVEVLRPDPVSP